MSLNEVKSRLKGVIPVQFCPYTKEGELDIEGLKENTKFLVDFARDKDIVVMTNGSCTEFYANSLEEQKKGRALWSRPRATTCYFELLRANSS